MSSSWLSEREDSILKLSVDGVCPVDLRCQKVELLE